MTEQARLAGRLLDDAKKRACRSELAKRASATAMSRRLQREAEVLRHWALSLLANVRHRKRAP